MQSSSMPSMNSNNTPAHTAENRAAQADEIEALKSIYGDDFILHDDNSCELLVRPVEGGNFLPPLRLCVYFPESYPSTSDPVLEIKASWLNCQVTDKVIAELHRIFEGNMGNVILFAWIEWLKEQLWVWEEARGKIAPSNDEDSMKLDEVGKKLQSAENTTSSKESFTGSKGKISASSVSDDKNMDAIDANISDELDKILGIIHGAPFTEKKSTFQAHLASVCSADDVANVMEALLRNRKIAGATHNIMAYRINIPEKGTVLQDYDDDGETAAGGRLLHLLQIVDASNVVVVVSRWFGGILLGPDRFKHINNAARSLLNTCGYIRGSGPSASVDADKQKLTSKVASNKGRRR